MVNIRTPSSLFGLWAVDTGEWVNHGAAIRADGPEVYETIEDAERAAREHLVLGRLDEPIRIVQISPEVLVTSVELTAGAAALEPVGSA